MTTRIILIALTSAAVIAGAAGCSKSSGPTSAQSSAAAAPTNAAQSTAGTTRDPCDLLSQPIAKQFAGDDAARQLTVDSNPPLPVGDTACFYQGSSRSVFFSINPMPTAPDAPV